ncbi:sigma-70 family RNA polymerase sigma factor [Paludisphaera borealis]|uniref:RNA polymerase sigma factor SigA n=1 Tax=Paludisphaera borealis TaxID=1387353 RepID=A0A1U7CPS1_9BACT|nr:sigma-70 family RNA polymerase sigma factor [Paludisphaera borealis]APW60908.1 RNA polymerase sigma factor SigA [Paludisphaera borealis]
MHTRSRSIDVVSLASADTVVLTEHDERALLQELTTCKLKLAAALASIQGFDAPAAAADPQAQAQFIARAYAGNGRNEARLGAVHHRYAELRDTLAMANVRLVAHVAKQFRDRGIPYADLVQEGFCGLLAAIDRFDMTHQTKLATYATWWIRQSMQSAVASGAYPVRLTPRHLRQLAQSQEQLDLPRGAGDTVAEPPNSSDTLQRIHSATRPTVSLDASFDHDSTFNLMQILGTADSGADQTDDEGIRKLMDGLRPREQQVLSLRFGLGGGERLSLSQVGRILEVSKERVRQIQESALKKLRELVEKENLVEGWSRGL